MDFSDIMKQAKEMQAKMQEIQGRIANMKVIGESGGGLVKVVMNGRHDLLKVFVDPSVLNGEEENSKDNKKMLEELIAGAVNDANKKIEDQSKGEMQDLAQDLKLPPGFEDQIGDDKGEGA